MTLKLDKQGLIPAIAQDINTGKVLMLGYMNPGSLKRTVEGIQVWFYSRSREDLWHKGEVSGNYLNLREAWVDCDGDTLLLKVVPDGPACHTQNESCFFTPLEGVPEPAELPAPTPAPGSWTSFTPSFRTESSVCPKEAIRRSFSPRASDGWRRR